MKGDRRVFFLYTTGWRKLFGPTAKEAPHPERTGGASRGGASEQYLQWEGADSASRGPVQLPLARLGPSLRMVNGCWAVLHPTPASSWTVVWI